MGVVDGEPEGHQGNQVTKQDSDSRNDQEMLPGIHNTLKSIEYHLCNYSC